ncbi:hypothetical protein KX746_24700, partial [Escherichia coli]|uniref:hypothetical protein n=1 Tax=Escherichia coli TaxID=562 RepID=UPI001C531ECC
HSVQDCPPASIDTVPNARKKRERFWCRNVTKGVRGALKRSQGSQIETFVTKRSKDPLEILFFCA